MNKIIKQKKITDYKKLGKIVEAYKILGKKVVCTIGSWDMLHIGHLRYLNRAKSLGDILIVGVDSDRAIKIYKDNPIRPIIPENERMEMLGYQEFIDYVTLIDDVDDKGNWKLELLKKVNPDIFVAVADESYSEQQKKDISKFCGKLHILSRQAKKTSSTNIVEEIFKKKMEHLLNK